MATVSGTVSRIVSDADNSSIQCSWTLTSTNADGAPIELSEYADVTWIVRGTWGTASAFKIQGSDDGTNFVTAAGLTNASGGGEVSLSADKVFTTIERPRYMRPIITTVGTGATLTVVAMLRRATPMRT